MGTLNPSTSPKVGFLLGLQSRMDTLIALGTEAQAIPGTFYLTQDTHRLYIGNSDHSISAVNEGVISISDVSLLPNIDTPEARRAHAGQFYYITGGSAANVLCVCSGSNGWVQINASSHATAFDVVVATNNSNVTTIAHTYDETGIDSPFTASFSLQGAGGITTSNTNNAITITGNVGSLSAAAINGTENAVNVTLNNSNANNSSIEIDGGTNTTVEVDSNGHVVIDATDTTVTAAIARSGNAGFAMGVSDSTGAEILTTFDPTIRYGGSADQAVHYASGEATLNIYTTTEVDNLIAAAMNSVNAMEYKGVVNDGNLPTTDVHKGDTWVLGDSYSFGTPPVTYPAGTMFIANGQENSNGVIPAADIEWDIIQAADMDTQFEFVGIANGIKLHGSDQVDYGTFGLVQGNGIVITDNNSSTDKRLTIAHATVNGTLTNNTGLTYNYPNTSGVGTSVTVPVITAVTRDSYGHLDSITTSSLVLENITYTFSAYRSAATASNNAAVVTLGYKITDSNGDDSLGDNTFGINSETLAVTAQTVNNVGSVSINLVWGSFNVS